MRETRTSETQTSGTQTSGTQTSETQTSGTSRRFAMSAGEPSPGIALSC